jgi:hypothetical protein
MKISEVDTKVVEAINTAKAQVAEITGRLPKDINVELAHGYDNELLWAITVFEVGYRTITQRGDDLAKVKYGIRQKHAQHLAEFGSSVAQVKKLAEELGVKVEVLS